MIIRKVKVTEYEYQAPINYVAGATEPDIQFQLTDYEIPSGATGRVYVGRSDGTFEYTVATISGNNVTVAPTSSMFSVKGPGAIQVTLYVGNEVVKNFAVPVYVHADLADDSAEAGSDVTGVFREAEEQALADFAEDAEAKAAEVIGSIPADYTELTEEVDELNERIDNLNPITDEIKETLLACFEHVAWVDEHGQDYYDALYDALYANPQPEPEVPTGYTRYDYIRLRMYEEVPSGVYDVGGANLANCRIYGANNGLAAKISTRYYDNLNALNYKMRFKTEPNNMLETQQGIIIGGRSQSGGDHMIGTWVYLVRNNMVVRVHGTAAENLAINGNDINTVEIVNPSESPSKVIVNGVETNISWANNNVVNMFLTYFSNFTITDTDMYFNGRLQIGDVEVKDNNGQMVSKLIPVVRDIDGVIGVYDAIEKRFYTTDMARYSTIGNNYCIYAVGNWK